MDMKISKTNGNLAFLRTRLDQVQMSAHERLLAEAQLARAEAVVEVVAELVNLGKRLLKALVARPARRPTASVG